MRITATVCVCLRTLSLVVLLYNRRYQVTIYIRSVVLVPAHLDSWVVHDVRVYPLYNQHAHQKSIPVLQLQLLGESSLLFVVTV